MGLDGAGIRRLPGYLHRHTQFLCHCTEPSDLPECDIANFFIAGKCGGRKRCLRPIRVDPTGALVGNRLHSRDDRPQCTDIQVEAKNGTGPYTLTVRAYY